MTNRIQNKLKMYRAVIEICERHNRLTDSIPVFASRYAQFTALVNHLENLLQQRMIDIDGVKNSRNEMRLLLCRNVIALSSAISIFAKKTGNYKLAGKVRCEMKELLSASSSQMMAFAETITLCTETRLDRLWAYGVSPAILTDTKQLINDLHKLIPAYTRARNARKTITAQFSATIIQADNLLFNHLDRHARIIGGAWPIFYKLYRNSRRVYSPQMLRSKELALVANTAC